MNDPQAPRILISGGTYVSIGLIALIIGATWAILNAVGSINTRLDKIDYRVSEIEKEKNTWSAVDMFKWAVHLQQLNADPKKLHEEGLKVPEPETTTK